MVEFCHTFLDVFKLIIFVKLYSPAQPHWAKDVILLFTEDGYAGAQAWLESYHDSYNSEFIKASPLEERAGDIQAALVLNLQVFINFSVIIKNHSLVW